MKERKERKERKNKKIVKQVELQLLINYSCQALGEFPK